MFKKAILKEVMSWVYTILSAFIITLLITTKAFAVVQVEQSSMENTLHGGQKLFIDKLSYNFSEPKRGDIIIFLENKSKKNLWDEVKISLEDMSNIFKETDTNKRLVKRIIGIPGDTIDIKNGYVYVNGAKLEEAYIKGETLKREVAFPIKVSKDNLFVLGDNRAVSKDSRTFGLVEYKKIDGKAVLRVWPFKDAGKLR